MSTGGGYRLRPPAVWHSDNASSQINEVTLQWAH